MWKRCVAALAPLALLAAPSVGDEAAFRRARENGKRFEETLAAMQRLLHAWLAHADPKTLLLPDRIPGGSRGLKPGDASRLYTPHNSGADLYPYLILTAHLTDPDLYHGRMMEMLRNEVRYTTVQASIPANLDLNSGKPGPPSLFGAGEYAKDGLLAVTEYLGRTPWFHRMVDMTADVMEHAPIETRFGKLPAADAELNGDLMQTLFRLAAMTGDRRFRQWGQRLGRAYVEEVLPGCHGVPCGKWDFKTHQGDAVLRLRDHGNETVVGLTLLFALENYHESELARQWRPALARMLDRILESANPDGMLYNVVDPATLRPLQDRLSDNWGYVYGAVYAFYQATGETKYRDAVRRVLGNLPNYRNYVWEGSPDQPPGSFDGYADSIESAIYLVNREPVAGALDWIESEMKVMLAMQQPSGHVEHWYGEGNFNRTAMLYALMKSQGARPERWAPGTRLGAVRDGERLLVSLEAPAPVRIQFDFARHKRVLNLDRNYVRLNEFPEWYTVDENTLYRLEAAGGKQRRILLGSELIGGVRMEPGEWVLAPAGRAPYAAPGRRDLLN